MCPPGRHVHRTADSPVGGPLGGCHLSAMAHTVVGQSCPAFSMSLRVVWGCVPPGWGSGMKGGYRMQTSLSTSEGFPAPRHLCTGSATETEESPLPHTFDKHLVQCDW